MASSREVTLVDVIQAVREEAANEEEILATIVRLISSGQVRLSDEAIRAMRDLCTPTNVAA
jgi:predicted nucleotidyltransferase